MRAGWLAGWLAGGLAGWLAGWRNKLNALTKIQGIWWQFSDTSVEWVVANLLCGKYSKSAHWQLPRQIDNPVHCCPSFMGVLSVDVQRTLWQARGSSIVGKRNRTRARCWTFLDLPPV
ncbi:hypothetical protein DPMN_020597 [Dreissena polymorpha]|uniref:Uncharacterized protein n=1 Tax=Dreissena polymorpha TaxID=45954 RepID=A0A9D4NJ60_DREPO|nr:hypothetical protein DPMN_020597 [Dreissena polymorpha]